MSKGITHRPLPEKKVEFALSNPQHNFPARTCEYFARFFSIPKENDSKIGQIQEKKATTFLNNPHG